MCFVTMGGAGVMDLASGKAFRVVESGLMPRYSSGNTELRMCMCN